MKGKLLFLAALALVQGRPNDNELDGDVSAKIRHELCPDDLSHFLLPHEYDCTKFYYCEFGEKFTSPRSCPPGTEFSFKLQVCVDPSVANCTLPGVSTTPKPTELPTDAPTQPPTTTTKPSSTRVPDLPNGCPADFEEDRLLPHETYCNKYYQCNLGEKVVRWCPSGTHFNPRLSLCDWPGNSACDGEIAEEKEDEDNGNGDGGDIGDLLPNGCPADFEKDLLLPNPANCSTYYQCVIGEKVLRSCPANLHFNPAEKRCDWPENAGCDPNAGGGGGGEDGGQGGDGGGDGSEGEGGGESGGGGEGEGGGEGGGDGGDGGDLLPNGCPANFDTELLLPNPANCSVYYQCTLGVKVPRSCPTGLHFNPVKKICDWPANAGCDPNAGGGGGGEDGVEGDEQDGGGGEGGDISEGGGDDEEGDDASDEDLLPNGCPANFEIELLLPNPANCSTFYQCDHGVKVPRICPAGLHFNPVEKLCDWPENAGCDPNAGGGDGGEDGPTPSPPSPPPPSPPPTPPPGGEGEDENKCVGNCNVLPWAHKTDCDKFWICNGQKSRLVICSEGLHFNRKTFTCDFICNANCVRNTVQVTSGTQGVKLFLPWNKIDRSVSQFLITDGLAK